MVSGDNGSLLQSGSLEPPAVVAQTDRYQKTKANRYTAHRHTGSRFPGGRDILVCSPARTSMDTMYILNMVYNLQ